MIVENRPGGGGVTATDLVAKATPDGHAVLFCGIAHALRPALYRKLAKSLNLAPDGHTEQTFKQILGSCQSIVEGLGALRNKLGDAHSVGPLRARPSIRHAELAVNLAGTMATFLVSTWKARQEAAKRTPGAGGSA